MVRGGEKRFSVGGGLTSLRRMHTSFHVHVYFDGEQRAAAMELRDALTRRYPRAHLGQIHEAPIAFHPRPMYQVALERMALGPLVTWLDRHRAGLSVLVHPVLGDTLVEHMDQALWLGPPLTLDPEGLRSAPSEPPPSALGLEETPRTLLRIDASARRSGSRSRELADELVGGLLRKKPGLSLVQRDLADGVALLEPDMLEAWGRPEAERNAVESEWAGVSEQLIEELRRAEMVVLALPIYNFSVPASFKAWIDLVARARQTFRYTAEGPVGLLEDRPVYVVLTSGGTRLNGPLDFVTPWLRHILGFMGLADVRIVAADGLGKDEETRLAEARAEIGDLLAQPTPHAPA